MPPCVRLPTTTPTQAKRPLPSRRTESYTRKRRRRIRSPGATCAMPTDFSRIYRDLGNLRRRVGHVTEADSLDHQRLDLWQYWDHKLPNNPFVQRQLAAAQTKWTPP